MKATTLGILAIIFVIAVGTFVFLGSGQNNGNVNGNVITGNVVDGIGNEENNGDVQKINIGMKNYNYYPNTIKVKADTPVEITLDNSVYGCLRSFVIKEFGVNKYSKDSNDKITFTPNKKGTFTFACSMNMGYGKLIVE